MTDISAAPRRAVLVGTGSIAEKHAQAFAALSDRVTLAAAVNRGEEALHAFADRHAIPHRSTDLHATLKDIQPDLVMICSPPGTHADIIDASLDAGAWVLCEKPLCRSLAEFDRVAAAEQRTGHPVSTVFQWRFGSVAQHLKQMVDTGALGRTLTGLCQTLWYRDASYYAVAWRGEWSSEGGGTSVGHGIHLMDLLLWLKPDWESITAHIATLDRQTQVETVALGMLRFADGTLMSLSNSALSPRQETALRLDFQRGTAEIRSLYQYSNADFHLTLTPDADPELEKWRSLPEEVPNDFVPQLRAVLDALDAQNTPPVHGDEARRILEFLACFYKSAFTGQTVRRGDVTPDDPFYHAMNGVTS